MRADAGKQLFGQGVEAVDHVVVIHVGLRLGRGMTRLGRTRP